MSETRVTRTASGVVVDLGDERLRVQFITDAIVRITATREPEFSTTPSLIRVPIHTEVGNVHRSSVGGVISLRSSSLEVQLSGPRHAVSVYRFDETPVLFEHRERPRAFERVAVMKSVPDPSSVRKVQTVDGEREIAERYVQSHVRDAWRAEVRFAVDPFDAIYGLGFDETDDLNLRGKRKRLYQHNLRVVIPSLVCTSGYGLLFDACCAMTFDDRKDGLSMAFDCVEELDYYVIVGEGMDDVVRGHRRLTGAASMLPRWAMGYVQSKERYKTQDELLETAREFRRRQIPLDVIVQDWQYWPKGHWGGFTMDAAAYPDPASLVRDLHAIDVKLMLSIWPNPDRKDPAGQALLEARHTLAGTRYFDAFDPAARDHYWQHVWKNLGVHGIDAWWCDSTEPVVFDWSSAPRPADADEQNIAALAKLIDPQYLNAYALEASRGIDENVRRATPQRRTVNLTRSGYAGSQRHGAVVWSGDVSAKWSVLAQQIPSALNFSAAGHPWWTTDIGAFFVKKREQWFWNGDFDAGVDDPGYRELYTRWCQFAVFLPMFRSHGTDTPREPWRFGEPGTMFHDAIVGAIHLRYRLLPYLYSLAADVHFDGASFLRPLAFAFPEDREVRDLKTQFLVGHTLMACPVVTPMYHAPGGAALDVPRRRKVYIPAGRWFDFWTGRSHRGPQHLEVDAPIDRVPLFVRAGSILPLGAVLQHAMQPTPELTELRIYPGTDASCSLYDDAGDGYGYERGEFARMPLRWHNAAKVLELGPVVGDYPGMRERQAFRLTRVGPDEAVGLTTTAWEMDVFFRRDAMAIQMH